MPAIHSTSPARELGVVLDNLYIISILFTAVIQVWASFGEYIDRKYNDRWLSCLSLYNGESLHWVEKLATPASTLPLQDSRTNQRIWMSILSVKVTWCTCLKQRLDTLLFLLVLNRVLKLLSRCVTLFEINFIFQVKRVIQVHLHGL